MTVTAPGDCAYVNILVSATPGLTAQMAGFLTKQRYRYACVFVDHHSDYGYVHMMSNQYGAGLIMTAFCSGLLRLVVLPIHYLLLFFFFVVAALSCGKSIYLSSDIVSLLPMRSSWFGLFVGLPQVCQHVVMSTCRRSLFFRGCDRAVV